MTPVGGDKENLMGLLEHIRVREVR